MDSCTKFLHLLLRQVVVVQSVIDLPVQSLRPSIHLSRSRPPVVDSSFQYRYVGGWVLRPDHVTEILQLSLSYDRHQLRLST